MNLRNVLRTYALLRQLSDDETALLNTLRSMNDAERESLVVALSPEKSTTKRGAKKVSSKSSRASGMAAAINRSLSQQRQATKNDDRDNNDADNDPNEHCQKEFPGGFVCNEPADANVHHLRGVTGYHEFDAGKLSAQSAGERSSTNGGETNSIVNSETEPENASSATGG